MCHCCVLFLPLLSLVHPPVSELIYERDCSFCTSLLSIVWRQNGVFSLLHSSFLSADADLFIWSEADLSQWNPVDVWFTRSHRPLLSLQRLWHITQNVKYLPHTDQDLGMVHIFSIWLPNKSSFSKIVPKLIHFYGLLNIIASRNDM